MDLHFCSRCGISIPQSEIDSGSAGGAGGKFFCSEHRGGSAVAVAESPRGEETPDPELLFCANCRVSIPLASYPEGWGDVSLGYEYPEGARVGAEDSEHTKWQYENAKLSGGRAVAELSDVAGYRLQFVLTNLEAQ